MVFVNFLFICFKKPKRNMLKGMKSLCIARGVQRGTLCYVEKNSAVDMC